MAVLCSRVCLGNGGLYGHNTTALNFSFRSHRTPFSPIPNPSPNRSGFRRRKRSPAGFRSPPHGGRSRSRIGDMVEKSPGSKLVMGEVKILNRGEEGVAIFARERDDRKPPTAKKRGDGADLALGSTNRLGPDPKTVNLQIRVPNRAIAAAEGLYAGSQAFSCSPPPSSVPMPAFLGRGCAKSGNSQRFLQFS